MTGEEFLNWLSTVYPGIDESFNPRDYEDRIAKLKALEAVIAFHQTNLFCKE